MQPLSISQHKKTGQKKAFGSHGDKIWSCSNDYDDEATFQMTRSNGGVCAGFSANWCFKMLSGVRDILSQPEPGMAMILQRLYDWQNYTVLIARAGLQTTGRQDYQSSKAASQYIEGHTGQYIISLKGHAVAACRTAQGVTYFFDPNFGCYKFNVPDRLYRLIARARKEVGIALGGGIVVYPVTLA